MATRDLLHAELVFWIEHPTTGAGAARPWRLTPVDYELAFARADDAEAA